MREDHRVPYRVCCVCSGNICRSPVAEAVLRDRFARAGLGEEVTVDSAGTGGWHVGEPLDPRAVRSLEERGYDLSTVAPHEARRFDPAWYPRIDLALALDRAVLRELLQLAPDADAADRVRLLRSFDPAVADPAAPESDLDVPDPYYGGAAGFALVVDLVEAAVDGVVEHVREELAEPWEVGTGA